MDNNFNVFELLESKYILTSQNVSDIREYIYKKYPDGSSGKNVVIFAETVNKIIENNLGIFSAPNRSVLKEHIYKNTLMKKPFSITARDVFHACIDRHKEEESIIDEFEIFSEKVLGSTIPREIFYNNIYKKESPSSNSKKLFKNKETVNNEDLSDPLPNMDYINYINDAVNEEAETYFALQEKHAGDEELSDPLPDMKYINYINDVVNEEAETYLALQAEALRNEELCDPLPDIEYANYINDAVSENVKTYFFLQEETASNEALSDPLPDIEYINYVNDVVSAELEVYLSLEEEKIICEELEDPQDLQDPKDPKYPFTDIEYINYFDKKLETYFSLQKEVISKEKFETYSALQKEIVYNEPIIDIDNEGIISNEEKNNKKNLDRIKEFYSKFETELKGFYKILDLFSNFNANIKSLKNFKFKIYCRRFFPSLTNVNFLKTKIVSLGLLIIIFVAPISYYNTDNVSLAINEADVSIKNGQQKNVLGKSFDYPIDVKYSINKMAETQKNKQIKKISPEEPINVEEFKQNATKKMDMLATAYDLSVDSRGRSMGDLQYGVTSLGTKATRGKTIAVDTSVIPLGSKVYVEFPEGYSQLNGIYLAEDTGRFKTGNIVDVFLGEDNPGEKVIYDEVQKFGLQKVVLYIMEKK